MARPKAVSDIDILATARRCFIAQGASLSAAEIASVIGVSHTTLFNRFGSKRRLMLAALGPPDATRWIERLAAGPDERPIRAQLVELGQSMAAYFQDLHAGLSALQAAGIPPEEAFAGNGSEASRPAAAFQALTGWLGAAIEQGRLGECEVPTLAATILGALQNRAFSAQVCNDVITPEDDDTYVARFFELLWSGIAPIEATTSGTAFK